MATNQSTSFIGLLARLFWMMGGPAILLLLAGIIAERGKGWFAPASITFLTVLIGVTIARRLDPKNSYGDPTTPANLRMYTVGAIGVGLVLWIIANLLGNHWLAA